jgi:hypothetical protein
LLSGRCAVQGELLSRRVHFWGLCAFVGTPGSDSILLDQSVHDLRMSTQAWGAMGCLPHIHSDPRGVKIFVLFVAEEVGNPARVLRD